MFDDLFLALEMPPSVVLRVDSNKGQQGKSYRESKPGKDDEFGLKGGSVLK